MHRLYTSNLLLFSGCTDSGRETKTRQVHAPPFLTKHIFPIVCSGTLNKPFLQGSNEWPGSVSQCGRCTWERQRGGRSTVSLPPSLLPSLPSSSIQELQRIAKAYRRGTVSNSQTDVYTGITERTFMMYVPSPGDVT